MVDRTTRIVNRYQALLKEGKTPADARIALQVQFMIGHSALTQLLQKELPPAPAEPAAPESTAGVPGKTPASTAG